MVPRRYKPVQLNAKPVPDALAPGSRHVSAVRLADHRGAWAHGSSLALPLRAVPRALLPPSQGDGGREDRLGLRS